MLVFSEAMYNLCTNYKLYTVHSLILLYVGSGIHREHYDIIEINLLVIYDRYQLII